MSQELQTLSDVDRQIAEIKTPPEANDLRKKIKAVQALAPKRRESYEVAFNGGRSFCEVSAKAGELWAEVENKATRGNYSNCQNFDNSISAIDAGFANRQDAMMCTRLGELTQEEREAYYHKCQNDEKVPSLGGLYSFWRVKNYEELKPASLPEGKYRIIYADPPWFYNDKCESRTFAGAPFPGAAQSGGAESHYPSMTIEELCDLPIGGLAEDNAVLFLWVTSPMLKECFPIIEAWGFEYKSSFVWDKVKHNMGHYNSVRHELLLICTRGSCVPDVHSDPPDSVQSIERTEHSEKPQEFRAIIDRLYPHGKRIELFARGRFDGWETWGNEC